MIPFTAHGFVSPSTAPPDSAASIRLTASTLRRNCCPALRKVVFPWSQASRCEGGGNYSNHSLPSDQAGRGERDHGRMFVLRIDGAGLEDQQGEAQGRWAVAVGRSGG